MILLEDLLEEWNCQREGEDDDGYQALISDPPQHICDVHMRSVTDVAVQGNPQPAARSRAATPVPDKFPGEGGIMRANMIPLLLVILRLMEQICPHVEVASRNWRATSIWKDLTDHFFDQTDGMGRNFQLWEGEHGWKKFKKAVLSGVIGHTMAYEQNAGAQSEVEILAHSLNNW